MPLIAIVDAIATGRLRLAREFSFEYVAMTQGEAGFPVPQDFEALPTQLRDLLASLRERHAPPGALLLAMADDQVCGTVAMRRSHVTRPTDALVERLYVRDSARRRGIARALMATVEGIATRAGFSRTVLSVMPSRAGAIAFYQANGYAPLTEDVDWPWPAVWLGRALTRDVETAS